MSFLVPLFLLGLGAVAVPLLVHLTHRERKEPVRFPSLMFVRRIPFRTERRQRIRNWPLFLLRAAAVMLVAAAFARPFLAGDALGGAAPGDAREVVYLLDRSYSMEYGDRWRRAVRAADSAIATLGPDDRATLVLFADRADAASGPTGDRAALTQSVRAARPVPRTTRYGPALRLARDLLAAAERPNREAVLITDLQRTGWEGETDVRLPDGTRFALRNVASASQPANIAVTDVAVERGREGDARAAVTVRLAATGGDATGVRLVLELDGEPVREQRSDVPAGTATLVRFEGLPASDRLVRARVRTDGDALARDDAFHFVLRPPRPVRILLLEHPAAAAGDAVFLRRALEIGAAPPFAVVTRRDGVRPGDLVERDVVIVNDAPVGGSSAALRRFVESGGGLLVVLGARSASPATALLAGVVRGGGGVVDRLGGSGATMSVADYDHPVFAPFRAPRSGDFSAPRFFRYRRIEADSGAAVLARFDDGVPALVEGRVGAGRVVVWASDAANVWSDLPVHPVFLPLVHRLMLHLARYVEAPSWHTAGGVLDLAVLPEAAPLLEDAEAELIVEAPAGDREALRGARHVALEETGFYSVRPVGRAGAVGVTIAVNPDLTESDLTALEPEVLEVAAAPLSDRAPRAAALSGLLAPSERERRQRIWWYLLVTVLLLLAAEAATAYLSHARR